MAATITNISLSITNETGLQDALQASITRSFDLTDYNDGTTALEIASGRSGEINNALYRVEGGDFAVDMTGATTDGTYYIYVEDTGSSIIAYADNTVPTWRGDIGGWYISSVGTAKAFFKFYKNGTDFVNRSNILQETISNITPINSSVQISITNQTEFEYWFGTGAETFSGTTTGGWAYNVTGGVITVTMPENTTVVLYPCDSGGTTTHCYTNQYPSQQAYILKTQIKMLSSTTILGFNDESTIVVKDDNSTIEDDIKFITDYAATTTETAAASGSSFTVTSSASFKVGDWLNHDEDNSFYKITSISGGTNITVDRTITGTAGTGNVYLCIKDIKHNGWTFDGRGGVDGLGGSIVGTGKSGGGYNIQYCANSILNNKIINQQVSLNGAGVYGIAYNITAEKIYNCKSITNGGGVAGCDYSNLIIYNCFASDGGGGAWNCDYSNITSYNCSGGSGGYGGGVNNCNYSIIKSYNCISWQGGGAAYCDYSNITSYNCEASVGSGGGAWYCDYSKIYSIKCVTAVGLGQIADTCKNCISIWGDTGTINLCTLGGVRLVENLDTSAAPQGDYSSNINGGYTENN